MKKIICKRVVTILMSLVLAGCQNTASSSGVMEEGKKIMDAYASYEKAVENHVYGESWQADLSSNYTMSYSDDTKDTFDFKASLKQENQNVSFTQKINSNGASFDMEGYYLDGRLYNSYNGISYYEDMTYDAFEKTMMVPFDPLKLEESQIRSIKGIEKEDGTVQYVMELQPESAASIFTDRYDVYGLADYDDYGVKEAKVIQFYDRDGYLLQEKTSFTVTVSSSSQQVSVLYESDLQYSNINSASVSVDEKTMEQLKSYVNYKDIDTSEDEPEKEGDTVLEKFRSRVVSYLGYQKREDGTYRLDFNTNEMYQIDFENCTFTYGRYSIAYTYNWKTDVASSSTCNYNFETEHSSDGCDVSVIDTMKDVRQDLAMELYYCGLSLEDLLAEMK